MQRRTITRWENAQMSEAPTAPRLACTISPELHERLQMTALVKRTRVRAVVEDLLGRHLLSRAELATAIANGGTRDDVAS
jgi:hypothetical protein